MSSSVAHDNLKKEIMLAIGESGLGRVIPYEVGKFRTLHNVDSIIKIGIDGVSDLIAILVGGYFAGIEVKSGTGKLSEQQKKFKIMVEKFDGLFIEARSTQQVITEIKEYLCKKSLNT